jgi:hypothetical protein
MCTPWIVKKTWLSSNGTLTRIAVYKFHFFSPSWYEQHDDNPQKIIHISCLSQSWLRFAGIKYVMKLSCSPNPSILAKVEWNMEQDLNKNYQRTFIIKYLYIFLKKNWSFNFTNIKPYPVKYFIMPGLIFQPKK